MHSIWGKINNSMLLKKILSSAMADHQGFIKGWANLWAVRTILLCAFDHQEGSCLFRVVHFRKPVRRSCWKCPLNPRQPTQNIHPMSTLPIGTWQCFALICISLFDDRYYTLLWILSNSWSNLQTQYFFPWLSLNSWIGVLHKSGNNNLGKNHFERQAGLKRTLRQIQDFGEGGLRYGLAKRVRWRDF